MQNGQKMLSNSEPLLCTSKETQWDQALNFLKGQGHELREIKEQWNNEKNELIVLFFGVNIERG